MSKSPYRVADARDCLEHHGRDFSGGLLFETLGSPSMLASFPTSNGVRSASKGGDLQYHYLHNLSYGTNLDPYESALQFSGDLNDATSWLLPASDFALPGQTELFSPPDPELWPTASALKYMPAQNGYIDQDSNEAKPANCPPMTPDSFSNGRPLPRCSNVSRSVVDVEESPGDACGIHRLDVPNASTKSVPTRLTAGRHLLKPRVRSRPDQSSQEGSISSARYQDANELPIKKDRRSNRTAHSLIERKYRDSLNSKMHALHTALQSADRADDSGETADVRAADQKQSTTKIRKGDILADTVKYIQQAEVDKRHMLEEIHGLRRKNADLAQERAAMCDNCSLVNQLKSLKLQLSGRCVPQDWEMHTDPALRRNGPDFDEGWKHKIDTHNRCPGLHPSVR